MIYFNKNFNLYKRVSTFIEDDEDSIGYGIMFLDFSDKYYIEINDYNYIHRDNFKMDILHSDFLILK